MFKQQPIRAVGLSVLAWLSACMYLGPYRPWLWWVQRWQQTNWYFTLTYESCNYNYAITNKSYLGECSGSVARKTCSWLPPLLFTFTLGLMPYLGLHLHVVRCWFSSLLHVVGFFLQISFPPSRKKQCVLSFAVIVFFKKVCNCYPYGHSVVSEKYQVLLRARSFGNIPE